MKKFLSLSLLGVMILSTTACAQTGEMQYAERLPPPCYDVVSVQYDGWGRPYRVMIEVQSGDVMRRLLMLNREQALVLVSYDEISAKYQSTLTAILDGVVFAGQDRPMPR